MIKCAYKIQHLLPRMLAETSSGFHYLLCIIWEVFLLLVWIWFVSAYIAVTEFLDKTTSSEAQYIFHSIDYVLSHNLHRLSTIVVISLFVFYGFLLINCHFTLRRLLKFSSFEQYERNIQSQIEDLRSFISESQQ
jgi:hypothetical protein